MFAYKGSFPVSVEGYTAGGKGGRRQLREVTGGVVWANNNGGLDQSKDRWETEVGFGICFGDRDNWTQQKTGRVC